MHEPRWVSLSTPQTSSEEEHQFNTLFCKLVDGRRLNVMQKLDIFSIDDL